eukprot:TRINITY_DN63570_c0_g1_i1.p1 TRINITY_DN63570_c0_g1~~TRINITY_DN63570_c0_g1_i1.p1  ORF type:complete len:389 (+),score=71.46 TRINITY_DN63570_c0_g1_i1:90-1256(+)
MRRCLLSVAAAWCLLPLPSSSATAPSALVRREDALSSTGTDAAASNGDGAAAAQLQKGSVFEGLMGAEDAEADAHLFLTHPPPFCDDKAFRAACKPHSAMHLKDVLARASARQAREGSTRPVLADGSEILKIMEQVLQNSTAPKAAEFLEVFSDLRHLEARDALALKETWTQKDTELLRAINSSHAAFPASTKALRARLPTAKDLKRALGNRKSIAIVGNGPSLAGHGHSIDEHHTVARFNRMVGDMLDERNTGKRTDIHVTNWQIAWLDKAHLHHFDLEAEHVAYSYCRRFKIGGDIDTSSHASKIFLLRPSVVCGLRGTIGKFSRGFLFYWLVGSLFEHMDLYGMGVQDDNAHFTHKGKVTERYLPFEHLVYQRAKSMMKKSSERV